MKRRVAVPLWVLILLVVCAVGGFGAAVAAQSSNNSGSNSSGSSSSSNQAQVKGTPTATSTLGPTATPKPSPTPTHTPQWTTIQTFKGNGNKKTPTFNVPNHWQLVWSCDPSSDFSGEYNVIVDVDSPDGTPIDPGAVNTICQTGNTGDTTQEYQGGTIYLDIQSEAAWTIQVQVLK